MQWNGRYRDTLQRFVRGDAGMIPDLMTRLYGSADLFPDDLLHACRPWQSVNYVTSHDGFTLYDLVSYNDKRNWANGHDNTDGASGLQLELRLGRRSRGAPMEVELLRKQQVKNFVCLLMLSNGTPMFRMGDEFLQTQHGNNNPYNQDNETTWLDWRRLEEHRDIFRFFQRMIAFRKAHRSISRAHFWRDDIAWYGVEHDVDLSSESRCLAYCLHGASQGDADLYVMINGGFAPARFGIHEGSPGVWRRVIDTSRTSPDDIIDPEQQQPVNDAHWDVGPHSVVVLTRQKAER